jgi:hypothetical protein
MSLSSCGSAETEELEFMWISRHRRVGIYVDQQEWMSLFIYISWQDEFEFMQISWDG